MTSRKRKLLPGVRVPLPEKAGGPHRDRSKYRRKAKHRGRDADT